MAIDVFKLGWSVGGKIVFGTNPFIPNISWSEGDGSGIDVLMTAGDIQTTRTPVLVPMSSIKARTDHSSVVKVLLADGVESINGTITFDCNKGNMQTLLENIFFQRKNSFSVYIGTEDFNYYKLTSCTWSSVTITASEGGVLNCSMAFSSNMKPTRFTPSSQYFESLYKNSSLVPYWQTGALNDNDVLKVVSWTLTINQNITPQYMNTQDFDLPAYFRVADWSFQISVQTLTNTEEYNKIQIGVMDTLSPILMTLDQSINVSTGISFGGLDAMGNYQYAVELVGKPASYADNASYQEPFSI